ncbi:MAG TPA: RNA polymerase sigma factor [Pyrinomonadaceae bacterium]|nr:RNA polymerase sigma factor [Pyrinomonadaceae bacterium]
MPERTTDEVLLRRAGEGDQAAFLELYDRHRQPIFRFAYRLLGEVDIAEDVTHDCFLSLIRKPENFRPERASLRTYLFAAARNLALKHFRSTGRETGLDEMTEEPQLSPRHQPLRKLLDEELAAEVRRAIFSLAPLQREALVLFEYEGLSLGEIAEITGADVGAVKGRLFRARERLKSILRPYLDSDQQLNSGREIVTLKEA